MTDLSKPYFGNPNITRQGKKGRKQINSGDVNTVADPKTLAFVLGLMGEAPDQMGFSALHPDLAGIKSAGEVGFAGGTALGVAPLAGGISKALKLPGKAAEMARTGFERYMGNAGLLARAAPDGAGVGALDRLMGKDVGNFAQVLKEQTILDKFGGKAIREKALAKKVAAAAKAADAPVVVDAPVAAKTKAKGPRKAAVSPDVYRKMADEQGPMFALDKFRNGIHLKATDGGYVGAPRTIANGQGLAGLRGSLDGQFSDAVDAIRWGDPTRTGDWYDRAKAAQAASNEPWQLPRSLDSTAVYSAGVAPETEIGFALKHGNSRALGEPVMAYRGAGMNKLDHAVRDDIKPKMGFKIDEYWNKNDPAQPNTGLFGVNDFRAAQGFGYTTPDGKIWKGGVSKTMHPFMDAETALVVDRANKGNVGGRSDWQGPHIQEAPWVYAKAQDLYGRGKNGRFGGDVIQGTKASIQEANNTIADYFYKHAASANSERIPGANTGHRASLLDAAPAEKEAYQRATAWDAEQAAFDVNPAAPTVGNGRRDALYSAQGLRQLPAIDSSGMYINSLGNAEYNPMTIARPLLDQKTGGGLNPNTKSMMDMTEHYRGLVDGQEAFSWQLPDTMAGTKGKNSLVLDSRNPRSQFDPYTGTQPTGQQLSDLDSLLPVDARGEATWGVSANSRGATVFPFNKDDPTNGKMAREIQSRMGSQMQEIFPSNIRQGLLSDGNSNYGPALGKFDDDYNIVPTRPFSGEATSAFLERAAKAPPGAVQNLSESEPVRSIVRKKIAADAGKDGTRVDIQNMRNFMAEADWGKAVEMIRRGVKPSAAVAALGYSLDSMAAPE